MENKQLMRNVKILGNKRETFFHRLQIIYNASLDLTSEAKRKDFKSKVMGLDSLKEKFESVVDEWNQASLEADSTFQPSFAELGAFDDMFYAIKNTASEIFSEQVKESENLDEKHSHTVRPRLPKIDLPDFNGDPLTWPLFYQTFKSLIHENSSLDPVSKIHYLLGKLKGKALSVCAGILPTAENYIILWNALIEKYEDPRVLASLYINQILDFKPMQVESVNNLNLFLERVDSAVNSLHKLSLNDLGDFLLTSICLMKLDGQTRLSFEKSIGHNEIPTYKQLSVFIKEQVKVLIHTGGLGSSKLGNSAFKSSVVHSLVVKQEDIECKNKKVCPFCNDPTHLLNKCNKFIKLSRADRNNFVTKRWLCFNCLKAGHGVKSCTSSFTCATCHKKHHSLLHQDVENSSKILEGLNSGLTPEKAVSLVSTNTKKTPVCFTVALATAVVMAKTCSGEKIRMRVLIDTASQCNFVTKACCQKLGLQVNEIGISVSGIGAVQQKIEGQIELSFFSKFDNATEYRMNALIIDQITDSLPTRQIDDGIFQRLCNFRLADDTFATPGAIDGIIGAELVPFLMCGRKILEPDLPILIDSPLGLVVMGKVHTKEHIVESKKAKSYSYCCVESHNLNNLIQKFWELESLAENVSADPEDVACEKIFVSGKSRDTEGRYIVGLPFKEFPPALGNSYETALRRFLALEQRFEKNNGFKEKYSEVMQDYIKQGHMRKCKLQESFASGYFIPHHGVLKLSSTSTPLRVVFDASAQSSNGNSLNDVLYTGAKLQNDVFEILLLFRLFRIAMTADVRQMYRQIKMIPEHLPYQKVLWRFNKEDSISPYELTTVTFGVKSSPFLALRTLKQLAADEHDKFPMAAKRLETEIYMDDVVSSVEDPSEAIMLYHQWIGLLKAGGFNLVKWASNSPELLQEIPKDICQTDEVQFPTDFLKVLGLQWMPSQDIFKFQVNFKEFSTTKRGILSTIARIWDPLGLLAPVIVWAKLLIKELWQLRIGWDETLPPELAKLWKDFLKELPLISEFYIPRHIGATKTNNRILVGFADASEKAYAAVVYLWVASEDTESSMLLCAKSRVAPVKTISIPRLELCAALLLANLLNRIKCTYFKLSPVEKVLAFSDSKVTLAWIKSSPHRWKTFVATRVAKIQQLVPPENWSYVKGEENPADIASRGLPPKLFLESKYWRMGPPWLRKQRDWPVVDIETIKVEDTTELKVAKACLVTKVEEHPLRELIERCGSWAKLLKVAVYILRFVKRLPRSNVIQGPDLECAEEFLIRGVQGYHFASEIKSLRANRESPQSLRFLRPFLHKGILRVGGRLSNATLSYDQIHPVLLPAKERFCVLLVDHMHMVNLHAGPTLLLSLLRQRYWILGARNLVRQRYRLCNKCFRCKPRAITPLMADLPFPRVAETKPFLHTGVDFGGPFKLTLSKHRGVKTQKGYLCLFVCLATRAVHLECASDLSTDTFLAAFKRFIARRGPCAALYSDQGTNFVGAKNYLDTLPQFVNSQTFQSSLQHELAEKRVKWNLNPPSAPHFGGSWEAGIKSVKFHLSRVIGDQILSYEEFCTVLCQIEALLNSRPLCYLSTDPSEPLALTPSHFLTLTPLQSLPAKDLQTVSMNRLQRWSLIDKIIQSYWKRWRQEYLSGLQTRQKWNSSTCPIKVGTVVIINSENIPPLRWPLGIIQELYPGKDGVVRLALVKTKDSLLQRPVIKLSPLPSQ